MAKQVDDANAQAFIPTPPVGFRVLWYAPNRVNFPVPADVIAQEAPGIIAVHAWPSPNGKTVRGIPFMDSRDAKLPDGPMVKMNGKWGYVEGQNIPNSHYAFHKKELERAEARAKASEEEMRRIREEYEKKQASVTDATILETARLQQTVAAHIQSQGA